MYLPRDKIAVGKIFMLLRQQILILFRSNTFKHSKCRFHDETTVQKTPNKLKRGVKGYHEDFGKGIGIQIGNIAT